MSRSPLMHALRSAFRQAQEQPPPAANDAVGQARRPDPLHGWTRRGFLLSAAGMAPIAMAPPLAARTAPRVAIIGAGIAGLQTAWLLKQAGVASTIYESSKRSGGRMYSATGVAAPGVTTELGGEFIDTGHAEILAIARRFGLELIDTAAPGESSLIPEAFLFGGEPRKAEEITAGFLPLVDRLNADIRRSGGRGAKHFDTMSIAAYLDSIGASGWVRSLLNVAFRTEYGMDVEEQTAMNLLSMISTGMKDGRVELFGESDERYKILGGNQKVADVVAEQVKDQIRFEHRLEALSEASGGYRLSFRKAGAAWETTADVVVLTLPFTVLRRIDLRVPLPEKKHRAIRELGYGTNSKMFFGFERRLWRERGYAGALFTGTDCQLVWDSSRLQPTPMGALTMLMGGKAGIDIGEGSPEEHERRLLPEVEKVWQGVTALRAGPPGRFHWPGHPHTLGAYASYKVGQWRSIRGEEFRPVKQIYFAGEHCSLAAQGYMEGGAETGRRVAQAIAKRAGRKVPALG